MPPSDMSNGYRKILDRADAYFDQVLATQPSALACRLGCSLCCHGLFEIGAADVVIIAEGLDRLPKERRAAIVGRATEIFEDSGHPALREASPEDKEAFFERTSATPCPALDESGACMIYDSRPLVCRTFGLPIRNGAEYMGQECELNFTEASTADRENAAWDLQWEDELGPEDEYTVPEAILLAERLRG